MSIKLQNFNKSFGMFFVVSDKFRYNVMLYIICEQVLPPSSPSFIFTGIRVPDSGLSSY